jgi:uncharacterized protein YajQ (UPF0234 family)
MGTPSFDIVSRLDYAELDNAINNMKKMMSQRFDFRGSVWTIDVDQKEKKIKITAEDATKHKALQEALVTNAMRRAIDPKAFKWEDPESGAGGALKRFVTIRNGLDQETAKKITKMIKESGLKVQASIQGEEVRVTGKQLDDLQSVMRLLQGSDIESPLQFVNMKR